MNSAVAGVLNKVLGDYVENLNAEQLNLSVFSGEIKLQQLKLKTDILKVLGLPFDLKHGQIGNLSVRIPWTSIGSSPLKIEISEIYMLVGPKPPSAWNEEEEKKNKISLKQVSLDNFETIYSSEAAVNVEPGFVEKLVTKIVDNLQVSINSIYIRYEDDVSSTDAFAFGIAIKNVQAVTCNKNWQIEYISDAAITYKLVLLDDIRVFMDYGENFVIKSDSFDEFLNLAYKEKTPQLNHRFLLKPTSYRLELIMNKNSKDLSLPQAFASLKNVEVDMGIETNQITHMLKILEFMALYANFQSGVSNSEVESEFSPEEASIYRELYKKWRILSKGKDLEKIKSLKAKLELHENGKILQSIITQRTNVNTELELLRKEEAVRNEISSIENASQGGAFSSISGYFWGKKESAKKKEEEEKKEKLKIVNEKLLEILKEKENFAKQIDNFISDTQVFANLPSTYVRFKVEFSVSNTIISLKNTEKDLLIYSVRDFKIEFGMRPETIYAKIDIGNGELEDKVINSLVFPNILVTEFLHLEYDQLPSPKLSIKSGAFNVATNLESLLIVSNIFSAAIAQEIDISKYVEAASTKTSEYIKIGEQYVKDLAKTGSQASIELNLDMKAPVIFIPMNIHSLEEGMLVLDGGHLYGKTSIETLSNFSFDKYIFNLVNTKICIVWNCPSADNWKSGNLQDFLSPVDYKFTALNCKVEQHLIPAFVFSTEIGKLNFDLDESILFFTWKLQEEIFRILDQNKPAEVPMQKPRGDSLVIETEALKDRMKRIKDIVAMKMMVNFNEISLRLRKQKSQLAAIKFYEIYLDLGLGSLGEVLGKLKLKKIEMEDLREKVQLRKVICNPALYDDDKGEDEFMDAVEEINQLVIDFQFRPKLDTLHVDLILSEMRIMPSPDLFSQVVNFFTKPIAKASFATKSFQLETVPPVAHSKYKTVFITKMSLELSGIEVWLPMDVLNSRKRIGCFKFGVFLNYDSTQEYTSSFDKWIREIEREYHSINDEASIEITHIGGLIGLAHKNRILRTEERTQDILRPSRISITYNCLNRGNQETYTKIQVNLESLCFDIGFRDLQFLKTLSGIWMQFSLYDNEYYEQPPQVPNANTKTEITAECDALQVNLLEDTGIKAYSLIHLHFSNFTVKAIMDSTKTEAALSTFLLADCYNIYLAAWEPLIEDWNFDLTANQPAGSLMIINFEAPRIFNINLTLSNIEIIGTLMTKLGQDSSFWNEEVISNYIPDDNEVLAHGNFLYVLNNQLDVTIDVWLDITDAEIWTLEPNQTFTFTQQVVDKLQASIKPEGNKHGLMEEIKTPSAIVIKAEEYEPSKGIFIESIGVRGFKLKSGIKQVACVLDISAENNEKIIKIQTAKLCVNMTNSVVNMEYLGNLVSVYPNSAFPLPLKWVENPEISPYIAGIEKKIELYQEGTVQIEENSWIVTEIDKYKTSTSVTQMIVAFKPPFIYQNLLPCSLSIFYNKSEVPLCSLSPGASEASLSIDPTNDRQLYRFELQIENEYILDTDWKTLKGGAKCLLELTGNFPGNKLTIETSKYNTMNSQIIDLSQRKKAKKISSDSQRAESKILEIYCKYYLVNKSDWSFECNKGSMKINEHSIGFLSSRKNIKIRTVGKEYGEPSLWSESFNVSTTGISGCIELNNTDAQKKSHEVPSHLLFGIYTFEAPPPLTKSKIVHIMPRYVIHNELGYSIYIRQLLKNHEPGKTIKEVFDGSNLQYQLDSKSTSLIQISRDNNNWSSPFSIQDIEDFQVKFSAREEEKSDTQGEWYRPQYVNGYMHYARIIISTEDEACIHISFLTPKDPEFRILNLTQFEITANQVNYPALAIPPLTSIPWAFDNLLDNRKIELTGAEKKTYEIEKIGKAKKLGRNSVSVNVVGVTREMRIIPIGDKYERLKTTKLKKKQGYKFLASMAGVGLSLIDRTPTELFYFSFQYITLKFTSKQETIKKELRDHMKIDFKLKALQIDNMVSHNRLFPILFSPTATKDDEETPFIQAKIHKISSSNIDSTEISSIDKYSWLEVSIQEMRFQINQESLEVLLRTLSSLKNTFGTQLDYKKFSDISSLKETCKYLDVTSPILSFNLSQSSKKIFFEFFHLCAIKIYITFKSGMRNIDFQVDAMEGFGLLRTLGRYGAAFPNISESPLRFRELIIKESFQTMTNLTWQIISNYIRQGLFQFYKILGSVDLLGNPIGLIDKLGTGVFEFLNEPVKGALKGPKSFALGLEKGVRSLIGNVIAGGFGSVTKLTGGLYELVKEVNQDEGAEALYQSDSAALNVYSGVKGGVVEIAQGFTGIFTKPWKGARKSGVTGFFKGIGSGLLGVATAPLLAALRLGTGIAAGITSAGTLLANGKVDPKGRVRFPRHFNAKYVLVPYNHEIAEAQELLRNSKEFKREKIVFYLHLKENEDFIILLTLNKFFLLLNADLSKTLPIREISTMEIHRSDDKFLFFAGNREETNQIIIQSATFSSLARLYAAVLCIPSYKKSKPQLKKIKMPGRYGSSCCRFR
ncbi:unnamed protein product [Blepharisma stoltei]|uniref:Vacuolar protein sorting-associated protein n=1 Tax=Blepharisma stoltei TaxID=1481888 RepID=A0AAU9K262_9CILI|nr:unnamed protein product [Blepharisma stoltei]